MTKFFRKPHRGKIHSDSRSRSADCIEISTYQRIYIRIRDENDINDLEDALGSDFRSDNDMCACQNILADAHPI